MGDWGGLPTSPFTTPIEIGVSKEMGRVADQYDSQFLLALGDNFYFDGVTNVHDDRFQVRVEWTSQLSVVMTGGGGGGV